MGKSSVARKAEPTPVEEVDVEARIAAIESDVAHIKTDLSELKTDVRELRGDMKAANEAIAGLRTDMGTLRTDMERQQRCELKGDIASLSTQLKENSSKHSAETTKVRTDLEAAIEKVQASVRLSIATNTIAQLLIAGAVLGIVGRALKWF